MPTADSTITNYYEVVSSSTGRTSLCAQVLNDPESFWVVEQIILAEWSGIILSSNSIGMIIKSKKVVYPLMIIIRHVPYYIAPSCKPIKQNKTSMVYLNKWKRLQSSMSKSCHWNEIKLHSVTFEFLCRYSFSGKIPRKGKLKCIELVT